MVHSPSARSPPDHRQSELPQHPRRRLLPRILVAADHDAGLVPVQEQNGLVLRRAAQEPVLKREVEEDVIGG